MCWHHTFRTRTKEDFASAEHCVSHGDDDNPCKGEAVFGREEGNKTKKSLFQSWNWIFIRQIEIYDARALSDAGNYFFPILLVASACLHQFTEIFI